MSIASAKDNPVSVDSLPTMDRVWMMLRAMYGTKLVGATLVAIIDQDSKVTVQTMTFPKDDKK